MSVVTTQSPKRKSLFKSLFDANQVGTNLLALCSTRWCVRASAMTWLIDCYLTLLECLELLKQDRTLTGETRSKIRICWLKQAKTQKLVLGIFFCQATVYLDRPKG